MTVDPTRIGVDPACLDLAHHFLTDRQIEGNDPPSDSQIVEDLKSLSEVIQQAVEDWFFANPFPARPDGDT